MRVLVINRWSDDFADYGSYLDHQAHQVAYVTVAGHRPLLPAATAHAEVVADPSDVGEVTAAALRCHLALGGTDVVLALSEFDLLTAARVREQLGVPGADTEAVLRFRDKTVMKQAVAAAGLRVPQFRAIGSAEDAAAFAAAHGGGPVMLKPRTGAASSGCVLLRPGQDARHELAGRDLTGYEAEEFVEGPIWHVDGLLADGELRFGLASRYLNTCFDFGLGTPLGSVVQQGPAAETMLDFALRSLAALGLRTGAFHLEVIEHADGPVFLEVGARVGGGEIPFVCRDVYGVDLVGDWVRLELSEQPRTLPAGETSEGAHGGFLMLPEPVGQRLVERPSLVGVVPGLYAEELPEPGHVFTGHGGYDEILGRFRYRADSPAAVEAAIRATLDRYRCTLEPAVPAQV
ncbi:biotin carboxylase [Streptacidiphilus pinicola]|uniref:Biotin carboxylase n=1 Tax=Streptacidiphilus pinicola TaxID=2219663 RepID=A0A2X0IHM2_9ACTN|nr:biotin carboxylase [Streptacidiphilus pinicola]RAG84067.1 biotin carboxylase [Streptacidiphilus pinicola]